MSENDAKLQQSGKSFARRLGVKENADYDERKLMILREAARAFVEKGVQQTSIDEIAKALNVTKPTIYHYVGSKDGIVVECLRVGSAQLDDYLADLQASPISGMEKLKQLFTVYTQGVADDFSRCLITVDLNALKPDSRKEYGKARRRFISIVTSLVEEGVKDGSIREMDTNLAAMALLGAFNFVAQWYRDGAGPTPEQISETFLDIFERGLSPART